MPVVRGRVLWGSGPGGGPGRTGYGGKSGGTLAVGFDTTSVEVKAPRRTTAWRRSQTYALLRQLSMGRD
jgi:hypothetical protein